MGYNRNAIGKGKRYVSEENAFIARRLYEEVFDKGDLDAADKFLAADAAEQEFAPQQVAGLRSFKQSLVRLFIAFPDLRVTLEDVVAADDKVVVRWTDRGTHKGEFLGIAPTGKEVVTTGTTLFRFRDGKIVEQWTNWDTLSLLGQLEARDSPPRDLVGRVLASQEEERRRVAYEIHDGLAQTAAAAHGLLETYVKTHPHRPAEDEKQLGRVLDLVQQVVKDSRRVIADLRPTALDDFGLAAALRLQVEALREEGWQISYDEKLGDERLPAAVETALYRVTQEALTNARKHAGTTRARVKLVQFGREVRLRVRDWGGGFRTTEPYSYNTGERVGLHGMRERVALLGGELKACSEPGAGTLIVAKVPLIGSGGSLPA